MHSAPMSLKLLVCLCDFRLWAFCPVSGGHSPRVRDSAAAVAALVRAALGGTHSQG
jgi:hypothetical protein